MQSNEIKLVSYMKNWIFLVIYVLTLSYYYIPLIVIGTLDLLNEHITWKFGRSRWDNMKYFNRCEPYFKYSYLYVLGAVLLIIVFIFIAFTICTIHKIKNIVNYLVIRDYFRIGIAYLILGIFAIVYMNIIHAYIYDISYPYFSKPMPY